MSVQRVVRGTVEVIVVCLLALAAGCGLLSETYHPPEGEGAATIVLINRIYPPGFNVWVDKKKAAFLEEGLAVRVRPGSRKIKLESKSTSLKGGMKKEDKRTFEYEVRVAEGATEQVLLAWEHPGYRYKEGKWESASKPQLVQPVGGMSGAGYGPGLQYPSQYPEASSSPGQWGTRY